MCTEGGGAWKRESGEWLALHMTVQWVSADLEKRQVEAPCGRCGSRRGDQASETLRARKWLKERYCPNRKSRRSLCETASGGGRSKNTA